MTTETREPNPYLVQMNRTSAEFWEEQRVLRDRRISDPVILATAVADIDSELKRGVQIRAQKTFETALAHAEATKQRFSSQRGRAAGKAKKGDSLQALIEEIVRKKPAITEAELRQKLKHQEEIDPIQEIDKDSIFITSANGMTKEIPLSGLKHRLSRAKKKLRKS